MSRWIRRATIGTALVRAVCLLSALGAPALGAPADDERQESYPDSAVPAKTGLPEGGGDHPKNEPCGQNGTNSRDLDNGQAPSPDPRTDHPVLIASGDKVEAAVDLVVALPNRDFVLEREYSSRPGVFLPRTSGHGWFFPSMPFLSTDLVGDMTLPGGELNDNGLFISMVGSVTQELVFYPSGHVQGRPRWSATGATAQFWERSVITLTEPPVHGEPPAAPTNAAMLTFYSQGQWEKHFFRQYSGPLLYPASTWPGGVEPNRLEPEWLRGLLAEERDPYGNRWAYSYELLPGTLVQPRVRTIRCYSRRADGEALDAEIEFHWIPTVTSGLESPNRGRLRHVVVRRPSGSGGATLTEVQRVVYYYYEDFGAVETGTAGDLVQVAVYERVDTGAAQGPDPIVPLEAPPVDYPARVRVTQYRYHTGAGLCVAPSVTQGCLTCTSPEEEAGFFIPTGEPPTPSSPRLGAPHQLKQVIEPEQVEWYAQRRNAAAAPAPPLGLVAAGGELVSRSAGDVLGVDASGVEVRVQHLAAKTVTYFCADSAVESNLRGRVRTQALRTTMPGVGSQGHGRLLKYYYHTYPEPSAPATSGTHAIPVTNSGYTQTTRITEALRAADGAYVDYRVRAYDTIMFVSKWTDPLVPNVVHESKRRFTANDATTETLTSGRTWVTHYEYDPSPRSQTLARMMTPSATAYYSPGANGGPPVYLASADTGLVYGYTYDANHRLLERRVRRGAGVGAGPGGTALLAGPGGYSLLTRYTYYGDHPGGGPPSAQALWRAHLPRRVERFTAEGVTDPGPEESDDRETTTYEYGFYPNRADNLKPLSGIAWVERREERETVAELGPGGAHVDWLETFDEAGGPAWSIAPNGALTRRVALTMASGATGRLLSDTRNAESPLPSGGVIHPGEAYFFYDNALDEELVERLEALGITPGLSADGGSLTTTFGRDRLGRLIETIEPGGVSTFVTREMRLLEERPGLAYYAEVTLPAGSGASFNGPASVEWLSGGDQTIRSSLFAFPTDSPGVAQNPPGPGYVPHVAWYDRDRLIEIGRTLIDHEPTGLTREMRRWHDVGGNRFYRTRLRHDPAGRLTAVARDTGALERVEYDIRDRVVRRHRAVTDIQATDPFAAATNEREVESFGYDAEDATPQRTGNGSLTRITERVSDTESRATTIIRDYRDRAVQIRRPAPPHEVIHHDNLRRVIGRDVYTALPADPLAPPDPALRARRAAFSHSQRGLPWRVRVAIDPTFVNANNALDPGPSLEALTWHDALGRPIARWGPDAPATKMQYDGLDRPRTVSLTDRGGDAAPGQNDSFADAASLNGDIVYEQTVHGYAPDGVETLTTRLSRAHDLQPTGDLSAPAAASGVIRSFTGMFYDDFNRPIRVVEYGTNTTGFRSGGAAPFDPSAPPSPPGSGSSGEQRVWEIAYNRRGLPADTVDQVGRRGRTLYDDAGRPFAEVENVQAFADTNLTWLESAGRWRVNGLAGSADQDRVSSVVYDGDDHVTKVVAHVPQQGDDAVRVTEYVWNSNTLFGTGEEQSLIASADLLTEIRYPDETTGLPGTTDSHKVRLAYNRRGELRHSTDQNGAKRRFTRDALGRITREEAHVIPSHIDGRVNALEVEYDGAGRLAEARSLHGATVLNAVRFGYDRAAAATNPNPFWEPLDIWQERFGAITPATPRVSTRLDVLAPVLSAPAPADAGNRARPFSLVHPLHAAPNQSDDLDTVRFDYSHADAWVSGSRIGRMRAMRVRQGDGSYTDVARYSWIGVDLPASIEYPRPRILLDHQLLLEGSGSGGLPAQGTRQSGVYPGYDPFGRTVRQAWVDQELGAHASNPAVPSVPPIVQDRHTLSKVSNYVVTTDARPGAKAAHRERRNTHDGLHRLTESLLGATTSGGGGSFVRSGVAFQASESWTLETLGDWSVHARDFNGDGDWNDPGGPGSLGTGEREERAHNKASEIVERLLRRLPSAPDLALPLTFDDAGQLREEATPTPGGAPGGAPGGEPGARRYTHDAWGRLVRVEVYAPTTDGWLTLVEHEHNALGWRIGTRADTSIPPDGAPDRDRAFFYDVHWRLIEERIDDDPPGSSGGGGSSGGDGPDRVAQHVWGPVEERGLDDAILRREGTFSAGTAGTPGTSTTPGAAPEPGAFAGWPEGYAAGEVYYLTDVRGSPVALVKPGASASVRAVLVERVSWSPYGAARHRPLGDIDGDGLVGFADLNIVLQLQELDPGATSLGHPSNNYHVDADFDRDGEILFADLNIVLTAFGQVEPPGSVSGSTVGSGGSPIGFCGSLFEPVTQLHHVRYRDYSATLGRWLRRDPIGYADGLNLYEYVRANPLKWVDPYGLSSDALAGSSPTGLVLNILEPLGSNPYVVDAALPSWTHVVGDWGAGFGDTLTLGLTSPIRDWLNIGDVVDRSSTGYLVGQLSGFVASVATGFAGGVKAAGVPIKGVTEFSHFIPTRFGGIRSLLNGNYVPIRRHALSDPLRMLRDMSLADKWPWAVRMLYRVPRTWWGIEGGALWPMLPWICPFPWLPPDEYSGCS